MQIQLWNSNVQGSSSASINVSARITYGFTLTFQQFRAMIITTSIGLKHFLNYECALELWTASGSTSALNSSAHKLKAKHDRSQARVMNQIQRVDEAITNIWTSKTSSGPSLPPCLFVTPTFNLYFRPIKDVSAHSSPSTTIPPSTPPPSSSRSIPLLRTYRSATLSRARKRHPLLCT